MFAPGDIISYLEMCQAEGISLQRGMNFRLSGDFSVMLMSLPEAHPIPTESKTVVEQAFLG
jgi:hypothetical protein